MLDFNYLPYNIKVAYVFQYIQIIFATIGIVSNTLTFCVYMRKRLRKYSFSLYMKVMVCMDTLGMMHSYRTWASFILGANLDLVATFFCKVDNYQPYVEATISQWLLVFISLDRLITIAFPNRFVILKNLYFQLGIIIFAVLYSALILIEMPLSYEIVNQNLDPNSTDLNLACVSSKSGDFLWINLVNLIVVVVFLNNILNALMVVFIFRSRRRINTNMTSRKVAKKRDRTFAINVVFLNLTSTLCKIPFSVTLLVANYAQLSGDQILMLFNIVVSISIFDGGLSFFVNMFVNSVFYNEFLVMFRLKKESAVTSFGSNNNNSRTNNRQSRSINQMKR